MVGMIYVGDHQTLLYTKYISCGPYGLDFEKKSNYKSIGAIDHEPHVHDKFSPKGLYVGDN